MKKFCSLFRYLRSVLTPLYLYLYRIYRILIIFLVTELSKFVNIGKFEKQCLYRNKNFCYQQTFSSDNRHSDIKVFE